ncbi:MAG TPA: hypothetical protein VHF90_07650 [Thermoleophilaceae bacterium]|nr:hypothetical protein [Thermoleophilaceae bacterium]
MSNALPGPPCARARVRPRSASQQAAAELIRGTDAVAVAVAVTMLASLAFAALAGGADARTLPGVAPAKAPSKAKTTVGGGAVAGTPLSKLTAPGAKARLTRSGLAIPPAGAPAKVQAVIRAGNEIAKKPYKWGGGHGLLVDSGYDCSGSVSYALRKARLMTASLASTGFMSWGRRGPGRWITIRANAGHAYMVVAGLRFDTSASKQTGSRWSAQMRSPRGYVATHPPGF